MSIFTLTTTQPKTSDEYDREVIAAATGWTAFQRRGRGQRMKHAGETIESAREAAARFLADCPQPVLIYAVTPQGRQAHAETITA